MMQRLTLTFTKIEIINNNGLIPVIDKFIPVAQKIFKPFSVLFLGRFQESNLKIRNCRIDVRLLLIV